MMGLSISVQFVAERILNSIPEGLLIAAFAWLLLKLVGRQNSGTRFAVWFVALVAIALVPFVPMLHLGGSVARAANAEVTLPGEWAVGILSVWGLVALFALARIAFGLLRLGSLRRNSVPVLPEEVAPEIAATLEECRAVRRVELRVSSEIQVPTAIGFFQPAILIPEWNLRDLSVEELRAVVLHEFAHLRRRDDWTNLAQKLLRGVLFFHPAVLWVEKRLSLEREMACDDAVLEATGDPQAYAQCLVSLAEKSFLRRSVALAQAAIGRARETSLRLAQILDLDRPKSTRVLRPVLGAVAGMVAVAFVFLPNVPKLVSFSAPNEFAPSELAPTVARSMLVPAKFVESRAPSSETKGGSAADAHRSAHPTLTMTSGKGSVYARATTTAKDSMYQNGRHRSSEKKNPTLILAKAKAPATQEMLVYTATTNFYQHGDGVVGVTEWRVMVVKVPVAKRNLVQRPNRT